MLCPKLVLLLTNVLYTRSHVVQATIQHPPYFVSYCSPINACNEMDIHKHNILIISEDMNVQIGKDGNNKFCLYNLPNWNSKYLADFSHKNRLACQNTKFQKRDRKLWTYTFLNNSNKQLYYIFINKKWIKSTLNCEAYSSFEGVFSDHRIISAKTCLSLCRNKRQTGKASWKSQM